MKTIHIILRCAPFLGLFAVALPGCTTESSDSVEIEEILCDKLAECGQLSGGVTAEQCATDTRRAHEQAVKEVSVCTPVFAQLQSLMVCAAQQEGCEIDVGAGPAELPGDHPCFAENESYKKALQAVEQGHEPDAGDLCAFYYTRAIDMVTTPATGQACKTNADCPDVECPDPALGRAGFCQSGKCKTAIDICR
ncbi:hypothetical protein BE04_50565 [Sorangium cellulosum]|uniref:Secreted protein n=2 Tax=Sorangium cellulosum TaxID=56 RepID=A0A150PAV8_SORCE|nr:hypothetical protein SCE1572_33805 [Sorangium cellulosum So0157-2]KYF52827.1 hypothetical protein BE04_50565 [Sorangium cellulosum]